MSTQSRLALSDPEAYLELLQRQAEENALLYAAAAPGTCASCRHLGGFSSGIVKAFACVHPDLKIVNNGDGTGIELLDFGCNQYDQKPLIQR